MRYKNIITGAVIDSSFKISGGDWKAVANQKEVAQQATIPPVAAALSDSEDVLEPDPEPISEPEPDGPTGNADIDSLGKKDIIQELEAMGIDHNPRDKKQVLYDLMMGK